jgi:SAM-dependent methyltransferase
MAQFERPGWDSILNGPDVTHFHIDRFSVIGGAVIISGWSEDYEPGAKPIVLFRGEPLETLCSPIPRPDVAAVHGAGGELRGFQLCAMAPTEVLNGDDIGLVLPSGRVFASLAQATPPGDDNPHGLFADFVARVNATGGRLLEIGARARSGNESRSNFGPNVDYVGADLVGGDNVDVTADAHCISSAVAPGFDYIFSISTFEHLLMPWKVVLEFNKILKPGGIVFTHSHQAWPCHDEPWDYFRFSRESWAGLFNIHSGFQIMDARRGDPVSIVSRYNPGGPAYTGLERSAGYGMSVCLAQKIGDPLVQWEADVGLVTTVKYEH